MCTYIYNLCVVYTVCTQFFCVVYTTSYTQIVLNGLKDKPWYYKGEWQVDWLWIVQSEKSTFKLRWCQRVNVIFPSPQFMLKPSVECDGVWSEAFGRWLGLGPREWSTHQWDLCPYKRGPRECPCPFHVWGRRVNTTLLGSGTGCSSDVKSPSTLILACQPPELYEINCCCF